MRRRAIFFTLFPALDPEAAVRQRRHRPHRRIRLDCHPPLARRRPQPVHERLKSPPVVAETRGAFVDPCPEPGQIDIPEMRAELAFQHRLPQLAVGRPPHPPPQPFIGQQPVKRAPRRPRMIFQIRQHQAHPQLMRHRQVRKPQHVHGAVQRIVPAPVVDHRRRPVDLQQIARARSSPSAA